MIERRVRDAAWHRRKRIANLLGITVEALLKRDGLAGAHLGLVVSIAKRLHALLPSTFDLDDLINVGNVALVEAAAKYDPEMHNGTPFSAFARTPIRGAMLDSVRKIECDGSNRRALRPKLVSIDEVPDGNIDSRKSTELARGLQRVATHPSAPGAIDRARLNQTVSNAIMFLALDEAACLQEWYADDEPTVRKVATRMGLTIPATKALHERAIAALRARVTGGPIPKAA